MRLLAGSSVRRRGAVLEKGMVDRHLKSGVRSSDLETASRAEYEEHLAHLHAVRLMKERVAADRLGGLLWGAPDAAAERALMGIVLDAFDQGEELEGILVAWKRAIEPRFLPEGDGNELPFDVLLDSLIEVKAEAARVYGEAARDAPTPELAERLARMGVEDGEHVEVLREIRRRL